MIDLTNLSQIKELDPKNVFGSTELLGSQVSQIWEDKESLQIPNNYKDFDNVVVCAMGGSALGGRVISSLYAEELTKPMVIVNGYRLPGFVTKNSLVILASYSGTTEETISCAHHAIDKEAKIIGTATGGTLEKILAENKLPFLKINPKFNPCGQPRIATGYGIFGVTGILQKVGLLNIKDDDISLAVENLKNNKEKIKSEAINIAKNLHNTIPVIFSDETFEGNAHILRNQFNESSKSFCSFSPIPELNHHLMEGLKYPESKKLSVLFLTSSLFSSSIKKRFDLTRDVVSKNNIKIITYEAHGFDKLTQMLDLLAFGGYVSLYLGLLYGVDPSLTPWVGYFKEQLTK
jgi:glucose/mannose-6-phosphate isomerase